MLEAIDIRKSYKNIEVLKGVSIAVNKSDLVCIIGASGAGKSTLLHIIGTLEKPDHGQLRIMETDTSLLKGNELAKFRNKHIGFVFQFHNLLPEFTALENICIPGYIQKESKKKVIDKAMNLMDLLKISHRKDHKPNELSGGEQQRTAVARALINSPAIVFADEPSGNLDSQNADSLHHLFLDLKKELKQTFIIATHNPSLASMADRIIEIKDGIVTKNQ